MKAPALLALALIVGGSPVAARKPPAGGWQVSRTTDPITGRSTCIVAALDRVAGLTFSRVGALYPFVENDPQLGLLVGVSSGGRYRIPTGDILWRVDNRPFRTLRAADNPTTSAAGPVAQDAATKAMQDAMALTARLTAPSTVASGDRAKEMLAEMLAGTGLIFRSAAATAAYGLPGAGAYEVGQVTKAGLKPYRLDQSFHDGLASCGISS